MAAAGLDEFEDDGCQSSDLLHDENGLPSFEDEEVEKEESFASDFYRCGTDWSCLFQSNRKLKQANLFDVWGMKSNSESQANDAAFLPPKKKLKVSSAKSKATCVKKRADRGCPFYKKIPGCISSLPSHLLLTRISYHQYSIGWFILLCITLISFLSWYYTQIFIF